jgi:hypothetical protein
LEGTTRTHQCGAPRESKRSPTHRSCSYPQQSNASTITDSCTAPPLQSSVTFVSSVVKAVPRSSSAPPAPPRDQQSSVSSAPSAVKSCSPRDERRPPTPRPSKKIRNQIRPELKPLLPARPAQEIFECYLLRELQVAHEERVHRGAELRIQHHRVGFVVI